MIDLGLVLECLALGATAGFLAGLLGVGGGMMMVPFLTMILTRRGVTPDAAVKIAIATSMATILFTSISSLNAHRRLGTIRWDAVRGFAPGILVGGLIGGLGIFAALRGRALAGFFAAFVGWSAWRMLRGGAPAARRELPGFAGMAGVGAAIGGLSGLVGAGGAFMSVPFMVWCNVPMHRAVGTSAALGFPIALANTLAYVIAGWHEPSPLPGVVGYLYLPALAVISLASVSTAPLGARTSRALDVRQLRRVFAVLLFALAGYMAWRAAA